MRSHPFLLLVLIFLLTVAAAAQRPQPTPTPLIQPSARTGDRLGDISSDTRNISAALNTMNQYWSSFFEKFNSNQGLKMTDKQQKILFAFEILNRSEQSLANLQKQKLEYVERLSRMRLQLATINDDLLPQSLDRYVSLRGTTDAEGLRDIRRQALQKERNELSDTVQTIQRELDNANNDIRNLDAFVKNLRRELFPQVEREVADL